MKRVNYDQQIPVIKKPKRQRRGNRKLLIILLLFFLILAAVLFSRSSLSKVTQIEISGNQWVSEQEILSASGLQNGDQFFLVNEQEIIEKLEELEEIEKVSVSRSFPGRIKIVVQEFQSVAFEPSTTGGYVILLANGIEVPLEHDQVPFDKPILTGWSEWPEQKVKLSGVLAEIDPKWLTDLSEIRPMPPTPSYKEKIRLYTRSGFEVITTIDSMKEKINLLSDIIYELRQKNITDGEISMLEAITHRPFSETESLDSPPES